MTKLGGTTVPPAFTELKHHFDFKFRNTQWWFQPVCDPVHPVVSLLWCISFYRFILCLCKDFTSILSCLKLGWHSPSTWRLYQDPQRVGWGAPEQSSRFCQVQESSKQDKRIVCSTWCSLLAPGKAAVMLLDRQNPTCYVWFNIQALHLSALQQELPLGMVSIAISWSVSTEIRKCLLR